MMQTYSGRMFDFYAVSPDMICITDIAHALSMCCRYNGHCNDFYSVAEHCVLGAKYIEDKELAKWFLLHDASEAYVSDVPLPIKQHMNEFIEAEDAIIASVMSKYGLPTRMPDEVKLIDRCMAYIEMPQLFKEVKFQIPEVPSKMKEIQLRCWSPKEVEREYIKMFEELFV